VESHRFAEEVDDTNKAQEHSQGEHPMECQSYDHEAPNQIKVLSTEVLKAVDLTLCHIEIREVIFMPLTVSYSLEVLLYTITHIILFIEPSPASDK
jgi:hypothetical protein